MKTTGGKVTGPKESREERVIKIYGVDTRKTIGQFNSTSLRNALLEYFERNWDAKGWEKKIVGNTIQISKGKVTRMYRALEIYQEP